MEIMERLKGRVDDKFWNGKKIFLTGVDGYVAGDIRRTEIDNTIDNYQSLKKKVELISITPTRYKIKTTSVYALD